MSCGNPAFYYVEKGFNWVERRRAAAQQSPEETTLTPRSALSARMIRRSKRTTPGVCVWRTKTTHGWRLLAGEEIWGSPPFSRSRLKNLRSQVFFEHSATARSARRL